MNKKLITIGVLVTIAIIAIVYTALFKKPTPYATKEKCEQATGKECYLFQDLCQVMEARTQEEAEANNKFLKDCLPKIGTWQPVEATSSNEQ